MRTTPKLQWWPKKTGDAGDKNYLGRRPSVLWILLRVLITIHGGISPLYVGSPTVRVAIKPLLPVIIISLAFISFEFSVCSLSDVFETHAFACVDSVDISWAKRETLAKL